MPICTRCGKDVDGVHTCTPPEVYAFEDLLNRLDGLERHRMGITSGPGGLLHNSAIPSHRGQWVRFEQVKTVVGQWIADQRRK